MAEKRKFAALAELHRHSENDEVPERQENIAAVTPTNIEERGQGRGRPATGKRSNPEWKLFSHFLKRKTQREAIARLQAADDGRDLSEILQELLENWLKAN